MVACCRLAENVGERVMECEEKAEEIGGNFATMLNITQSERKPLEGAGAGNARYGRREIWTPCPSFLYRVQATI